MWGRHSCLPCCRILLEISLLSTGAFFRRTGKEAHPTEEIRKLPDSNEIFSVANVKSQQKALNGQTGMSAPHSASRQEKAFMFIWLFSACRNLIRSRPIQPVLVVGPQRAVQIHPRFYRLHLFVRQCDVFVIFIAQDVPEFALKRSEGKRPGWRIPARRFSCRMSMASGQAAMIMSRWRASPESIGGPRASRSRARLITLESGRLAWEVPVELRGRPAVSSLSVGQGWLASRLAH